MAEQKKKTFLKKNEKSLVLQEIKNGESRDAILNKYKISKRTLRKIIQCACESGELSKKSNVFEFKNKKPVQSAENAGIENAELEAALFEWFIQKRDSGQPPISRTMLEEKIRIFNEMLKGPETFEVSNSWLFGLSRRCGIRMKKQKYSVDPSGAAEFSQMLKAEIESGYLKLDNIYNADESGILWRLLMACTLALQLEEEEASERKGCKDRVTALFCANASGSHRIPLLLIGKSETPTCLNNLITKHSEDQRLKNLESLGVIYTHQASAWMDRCIFMLWYKNEFIPRVLERQRKDGITGKVVLLLDNAPSHPSLDELNAINENFKVIYLPPSVPALIQPMAQGLITTTKKLFKKELLRRLLLSKKSEGAAQFLKELDLPDCFGMLSLAWDAVKSFTVQKAWQTLLGDLIFRRSFTRQETKIKQEEDPLLIDDAVVSEPEFPTDLISLHYETCDQVSELLSGPDYSEEKSRQFLLQWFENDYNDNDCGWELSSDSEIVSFVTSGSREPQIVPKIENSETMFGDPDIVSLVANGRCEPDFVIKIENSESIVGDPDTVNFDTNGRLESEIVTKIENSEIVFKNAGIVNFLTNGRCEPQIVTKIENSETMFEDPESMEITSSSEAFDCLMKLKSWAKSRTECLPNHLDYIRELENLITGRKVC